MKYLEIVKIIDGDESTHLARLLILLKAFAGVGDIKGLTKVAKLDFFLRYPQYLERALTILHKNPARVKVLEFEKSSIEAKMVRFKYSPWDFRYRKFINQLISMDLAYMYVEKGVIHIGITELGTSVTEELIKDENLKLTFDRARLIKTNLNKSGTNLMRFIYDNFPEIGSLDYGKEIEYEN